MYKLNRIMGTLCHCGYHLTTSIVVPPLLSLPYAHASLGWMPWIFCLVIAALVSGDNLFIQLNLSGVLEHHAQLGCRYLRFRDMAEDILGMNTTFPTLIFGPLYDYISGQISIPIIYTKKNRIRLSKYTTRIHSCYMSIWHQYVPNSKINFL